MHDTNRPHVLYRFFDAEDQLLYVGITGNPLSRLIAHNHDKRWFGQVKRSTMDHFESRTALAAAEIQAIQTEKPKYNLAHTVISTPDYIGVKTTRRSGADVSLGSKFKKPDAITDEDHVEDADHERRLDELEEQLARKTRFMVHEPCPECFAAFVVREFDGLIRCDFCQNMWAPEEWEELRPSLTMLRSSTSV